MYSSLFYVIVADVKDVVKFWDNLITHWDNIIWTKFLFILYSARALGTTTQYIIIYLFGNVRTT